MVQALDLNDELFAAERAVWEALRVGDAEADAAALCDSFLGVYPDGMFGKADHVRQLSAGPTIATFQIDQVVCRAVGVDHGLICYRAQYTRPGREEVEAMYVSSLWKAEAGVWRNVFSQDTPAQPGLQLP